MKTFDRRPALEVLLVLKVKSFIYFHTYELAWIQDLICNNMIDPSLIVTEDLIYATRMLLSTNSEPMIKHVLYFAWLLSMSVEKAMFTLGYFAKNVSDLVRPIAQGKVHIGCKVFISYNYKFCSLLWIMSARIFLSFL